MSLDINNAQNTFSISRLVIGAPQGRSGKTTVTLGLLRSLRRKGLKVQPFKKGPDYIDPSWHTAAAGRISRNLDSFLMSKDAIRNSIIKHSSNADITLIEGAMGLHDGLDINGSASTAEIAKISQTPVLLILDTTRITRTTAAIVLGCQQLDPELQIAGVILNKVARPRHIKMATQAIEKYCGIPVVGAIPRDKNIIIPDRHLGLVTNNEMSQTDEFLNDLADLICENVDIDQIVDLAQSAPDLAYSENLNVIGENDQKYVYHLRDSRETNSLRIGVLQDKVFSFYYPENLEALESLGAELVPINALTSKHLPKDIDALYIGGGFPEVFAEQLENNITLLEDIRLAGESNMPIYAECGGLVYLGRSVKIGNDQYKMVGLLPLDTEMQNKPQGHGYTIMAVNENNLWFKQEKILGHEFHNSKVVNIDSENIKYGFKVLRGYGIDGSNDGICYKNVFAAYNHVHATATPEWAIRMIDLAKEYKQSRIIVHTGA